MSTSNVKQGTADALRRMMRQNVLESVEAKAAIPKQVEPLPVYATVAEGHKIGKVPSNAKTETVAQQDTQTQAAAIEQKAPKQGVYSQLYTSLFSNQKPESPEEVAKREKREKTRQTIANLSDSLAHVANVWGAVKGGTPANLSNLSDANRRRYEYANRQRLENTDAWQRGMYKAQTLDMQNDKQDAIFKAQQEAAQRKYDYDVQKAQQENERKDLEFKFKVEEAERKHKLDAEKAKADRDYREGMLGVARTNAATSARRADTYAQALQSRTTGTGANKMVQFAMSDGSVVEVPKSLEKDYYADVHKVLADVVLKSGDENAMKFLNEEIGMFSTKSQKQKEDIHAEAKRYPEVEEYMKKRAQEYRTGVDNAGIETPYNTIDDDVIDDDEDIDPVMQALENLIPNM